MSSPGILLKAVSGMDLDTDELYKSDKHAAFIKNMSIDATDNAELQDGEEGNNEGVFTPSESTELVNIILPDGDNYCCGFHEAVDLNEAYTFVFNTLGNHCIYVLHGDTGLAEMVKIDRDFNFQLDPRYYISPTRCVVISYLFYNKVTKREERKREMVFTDNFNPVRYLNVGDCMATGGFDANRFPFFKYFKPYKEWLINQGLPMSFSCIGIKAITPVAADKLLDNRLRYSTKFRIKHIDVWGRESEHGIISSPYYNPVASCLQSSDGVARCLELQLYGGPPTVSKIVLEVSTCSGNSDLNTESDWSETETIEKYDQSTDLNWWERKINPDLKYDIKTGYITYTYCNDKNCKAIPSAQTDRRFNPIPITAGSVFAINKSIGLANHKKKNPLLGRSVLQNLSFDVVKPKKETTCAPKGVNITVYALLYTIEEKTSCIIRKDGDNIIFGADKNDIVYETGQVMPKGQEGIIGYFAGTTEYAICTQCAYHFDTGIIEEVGLDWKGGNNITPILRWQFKNVLPGKRVFRVASHKSSPADDYQKTSTNVLCRTEFTKASTLGKIGELVKEIVVEACDKDMDLRDFPLMICDVTSFPGGIRKITNAIAGYVYEDQVNKIPIEGARVDSSHVSNKTNFTDHNGYYFAEAKSKGWHVSLFGTKDAKYDQLLGQTETTEDSPGSRFKMTQDVYVYKNDQEYKAGDRISIKGKVLACGSGVAGISGIPVILTNGSVAVTNSNGEFSIVAHDRGDGSVRKDRLIYQQGGRCVTTSCAGNCSYCFPDVAISLPALGSTRLLNVADFRVSIQNLNVKGPQNGGRYELGIIAHDWLGRTNGFESLPSFFLDVPTVQETGVFGFSHFTYKFNPNTVFPDFVKNITIAISANLNWDDFITWYAEKVEKVDSSGNVNKVNPTQLRIYYRGMLEYNLQNGLNSNATWQFIDDTNKTIPGDRVEFIANGDGKIFTTRITALVKQDTAGTYFTIDYTDDLKDLTDGALMKMIRAKSCVQTPLFYETCLEIELVNHKIPTSRVSGTIDYWDAYMINRVIPVPVYDDKMEKIPAATQLKRVAFPFEHHSPSDNWGSHCTSRGRAFAKDPYATVQYRPTEIGISKALVNDGVLNGLSYFSDADFNEFDKQDWGSITAVIPYVGGFLVICEQNNFLVGFDENTVRMNSQGAVVAKPADERFGRPERKTGSEYGCQPADINTLQKFGGVLMFLDSSKSAWVLHDYASAQDATMLGCHGWLKDKIKHVHQYNANSDSRRKYFTGGVDPRSKNFLLTMFSQPIFKPVSMQGVAIGDYVNTLRELSLEASETISLNPFKRVVREFKSYTPEYFGMLIGHQKDQQLITFKQGRPYLHHKKFNTPSATYLNFYGVQCEAIYEPVLNVEQDKDKRFLCTEVLCKKLFFCDRILTEASQLSRLMITHFKQRNSYWAADFKGDINTFRDPNDKGLQDADMVIHNGTRLHGKWIKARYVSCPKDNGQYFEFDGVHIFINGLEKSGTK